MSLNVFLHSGGQMEVAKDPHRFRIVCAGRRWGKSVLSRMVVLKWAVEKEGLYWIVSPTYKQSKMIHWRDFAKEIPPEWIKKKNEVELSLSLKNGSVIELKGAENPDALRGVKLRGLVIDEIASIRNWSWLWAEVLRPTLTDYEAPAVFISTPRGFNHFHELFLRGQNNDGVYRSWRFTSFENPYISQDEIKQAKKELTEDAFAQEYLADFRKHTGLIYKDFDRDIHVIQEPFDVPPEWDIYRGIDFGSNNPTACLWVAKDGDENFYIIDEYYQTDKTIDYHSGVINANKYSPRVRNTYGDPSGAQWISEFSSRGVYITPADKETGTSNQNWVNFGIDRVAEKLKVVPGHFAPFHGKKTEGGLPSLYILAHCRNTINEFEKYSWQEKSENLGADINDPEKPEKALDHAMDALRYIVVSVKSSPQVFTRPVPELKSFRIGL